MNKEEIRNLIQKETRQLKQKNKELENQISQIKKENQKLKQKIHRKQKEHKNQKKQKVSRREFLKKLGAGALGLGALSLPGASALNVKTADSFDVFTTSTKGGTLGKGLTVDTNQNVSIPDGHLTLATGHAIKDSSSQSRFTVDSDASRIFNPDGDEAIAMTTGNHFILSPNNTSNVLEFKDNVGVYRAMAYYPDTTRGTFELTNADLNVPKGDIWFNEKTLMSSVDSDSTRLYVPPSGGTGELRIYDPNANTDKFQITESGPVEVLNSNLRLPEGQAIEDDSGNPRVTIESSETEIYNQRGEPAFRANAGVDHVIDAYSDTPFAIWDREGGFYPLKYHTSASAPGRFELYKSNLEIGFDNEIRFVDHTAGNVGDDTISWPDRGASYRAYLSENGNGEIIARDNDGNTVVLT